MKAEGRYLGGHYGELLSLRPPRLDMEDGPSETCDTVLHK